MKRNLILEADNKPMINEMKLKESLRRLLKERDLTASQLARATKISVKTLHNWLQGQTPKNLDQLKTVADFLNVSIEQICWGIEATKTSHEKNVFKEHQDSIYAGKFEVILRKIKE